MIEVTAIVLGADILERLPVLWEPATRARLAADIMEGARAMVIKKAGESLDSTRLDFIQGVQPIEVEEDGATLIIAGALPNMVEGGWPGQFLHDTLLSNDATGWKISAEGFRYRSIPFRHKTPGAATSQGGQRMGSQFAPAAQASMYGKKVRHRAQRLVTPAEKAQGAKGRTRLQAGLTPKLRPHHTTDIFAGMIVNKQIVAGASGVTTKTQRTYTTFRTISEAVPDKFYHPGIEARHFLDEVEPYVQKMGPAAVEAFVKEALKP